MAFPVGLLLLGGLGLAGAFVATQSTKRLPEGSNPFDDFPPGVDRTKRLGVDNVTASSGRKYKVSAFRHSDGRLYYVAEKAGDLDWISYFFTPSTGARTVWHRNADTMADITDMLADFDMAGQQVAA